MKSSDFSPFIERYITGEMEETERIWFEKELDGNDELRRETNLRKMTDTLLKDKEVLSLRNKLSAIEAARKQASDIPVQRSIGIYRYAAVFVGLALIGSIFFFPGKPMSNEDIIKRYYDVYEFSSTSRSVTQTSDNDFRQAVNYYNMHDFKNAAKYFTKVLDKNPKEISATFLNGISNFETANYPEAKSSFNSVIEDNKNLFIEDSKWYLALCYLRTDETDTARENLLAIKNSNSRYKNEAKKILKKMR